MKVITELELRDRYRKKTFDSFTLEHSEKLTPSASQFLSEKRIKVIQQNEISKEKKIKLCNEGPNIKEVGKKIIELKDAKAPEKGYLLLDTGQICEKKPEAYTHLKGRFLVRKNHKRIVFRGKLDSFQARLINTIVEIKNIGYEEIICELTTIFEYTKKIMRADVFGEELQFIDFKGWSEADIREYSHHPDKYFGVKHSTPEPRLGKIVSLLNLLRTEVRELEIAAVDAFYEEEPEKVERLDIITALNRMSSLIYIIMCKYIGGFYKILDFSGE